MHSRLTRGDERRNIRLARLRAVVRPDLAIVGVDLASERQAAAVCDHESAVLGKKMFTGSPWTIDEILDWALPIALRAGYSGVVVCCEPTGHRWKPLLDRCRARGIVLTCVNPMLVARAREAEDFTKNRADLSDAVIIARLCTERRCHLPYLPEAQWSRLRHLGVRRNQLLVRATAGRRPPGAARPPRVLLAGTARCSCPADGVDHPARRAVGVHPSGADRRHGRGALQA
jgi:hypothetical protein